MIIREKRKYIVKLGEYEFNIRAFTEEDALTAAYTMWLDNEDIYPEDFSEYSVKEAPLILTT